jgi:hypothetical protein
MKLSSHNSLSGYKLLSWWFALGIPFSRCQSKDLVKQYLCGVRYFDLRFAYYKGRWYGAHGLMLYNITIEAAMATLQSLSSKEDPIYFRVVCEDTFYKSGTAEDLASYLSDLLIANDTLKPICVRSKKTWSVAADYSLSEFEDINICWDKYLWQIGTAKLELGTHLHVVDHVGLFGCYSSRCIPILWAFLMRRFIRKLRWDYKNIPVMDFVNKI